MRSTALSSRSIGLAVPQRNVDFFAWPCIVGEDFPPTFNNPGDPAVAQYGTEGVFPDVEARNDGGAPASVTWPALPLYSPATKLFTGWQMSFRLIIIVGEFATNVSVVSNPNFTNAIRLFVDGLNGNIFFRQDSQGYNTPVFLVTGEWTDITIGQRQDGSYILIVNGTNYPLQMFDDVTDTFVPAGGPIQSTPLQPFMQAAAGPGFTTTMHAGLTALSVSYL